MEKYRGSSTANTEWDIVPKKCEPKSDDLKRRNTPQNYHSILGKQSNPEKQSGSAVLRRRVQGSEPAGESDTKQQNKGLQTNHKSDLIEPTNGGISSLGKFDSFMYYSLPDIRKQVLSNPFSSDKILYRRSASFVDRMGLRRPSNGMKPLQDRTENMEPPSFVRRRSRLSFEGHPLLIHDNILDSSNEETDSEEE